MLHHVVVQTINKAPDRAGGRTRGCAQVRRELHFNNASSAVSQATELHAHMPC